MPTSIRQSELQEVLDELVCLKKLMILTLLEKGYSQTQIALALGIGQATVSRMFPAGVFKGKKGKKKVDSSTSTEPEAAG